MEAIQHLYAPFNLPRNLFTVVERDRLNPHFIHLNIHKYEHSTGAGMRDLTLSKPAPLERPDDNAIELTWDTVWWRQFAYVTSVFICVLIAAQFQDRANTQIISSSIQDTLGKPLRVIDSFLGEVPSNILTAVWLTIRPVCLSAVDVLPGIIPAFLAPYTRIIKDDPGAFFALLVLLSAALAWGALLDRRIQDRAISIWSRSFRRSRYEFSSLNLRWKVAVAIAFIIYGTIGLCSTTLEGSVAQFYSQLEFLHKQEEWRLPAYFFLVGMAALSPIIYLASPAVALTWIAWSIWTFRTKRPGSREIQGLGLIVARLFRRGRFVAKLVRFYSRTMVPGSFVAVLAVLAVLGLNKAMIHFLELTNRLCPIQFSEMFLAKQDQADAEISMLPKMEGDRMVMGVDISNGCTFVPFDLKKGKTYKITLTSISTWSKEGLILENSPDPEGFWTRWYEQPSWILRLPFRRMAWQPWFKPIIQELDLVANPLRIVPGEQHPMGPSGTRLTITATKSSFGLQFYINDVVIGLPKYSHASYRSNKGLAQISIEPAKEDD
jgi:hypothetical protein